MAEKPEESNTVNRNIPQRFIIDSSEPFQGYCQTSTYTACDGIERVQYNDDISLGDYLENNPEMKVISANELDDLFKIYMNNSKVGSVKRIDKEIYFEKLNVLPPCRWSDGSFHVSERLMGDLVSWYFKIGDEFYTLIDEASASKATLQNRIISEIN